MKDITYERRRDYIRMENPSGSRIGNFLLGLQYSNKFFFDFKGIGDIVESLPQLRFDLRIWHRPIVVYGICDYTAQVIRRQDEVYLSDHTGELKVMPFGKDKKEVETILRSKNRVARFAFFDMYLGELVSTEFFDGQLLIYWVMPEKGPGYGFHRRAPKIDIPDFFPDNLILPAIEPVKSRQLEEILV